MSGFFAVIRWLHLASLMMVFGSAVLRALLRRRLPALTLPPARWRLIAAMVAAITAPLWLGWAVAEMAGNADAMRDPVIVKLALAQTLFGQLFLIRFALLLALCAAMALKTRETLLACLSGFALVLISVTGHAAEASPANFTLIGATSDGLHLLTGGFWVGGLCVLAMLFARGTERGLLARATAIFAEWGMVAVAILVLTGMLNAASILLGGQGHDTPLYLAVLGTKLALVLAMVTLALFNHFRLLPQLSRDDAAGAMARHIRWELALGAIVVGLAALLGLIPPTL